MSKSVEGSYITLSDNLETISKRLAAVPTDSGRGAEVPQSGSVANLLRFVELFQGNARKKEYEAAYTSSGIRYGELKKSLAKAVFEQLQPIQEKRAQLVSDVGYVDDVIRNGAKQAGMLARETLNEVRQKVGLG